MKNKIFMSLCLLLALTACGGEDDPTEDPDVDPNGKTENPDQPDTSDHTRTILVYMAGENSLNSFTASDYAEIKSGMSDVSTTSNRMLVYIDDTSSPRLVHVVTDAAGNVTEEIIKSYDEQDSVDPDVMGTVFKDAFEGYPSQSYGLILWSHGEGWLPDSTIKSNWWGVDNNANSSSNNGNYMEIKELAAALSQTVHFDFILFDACFMLSAEVLYELKDYADYFVGSPAEIPGPGMRYDLITPLFFSTDADYVCQIARRYFETYAADYNPQIANSNNKWTAGVAIGAVKSDALPALATATANIVVKYVTDESGPIYSTVMCYDPRTAKLYYHDLKDFIHQETGSDTAAYEQWLISFDEAMIYWGTTPTTYSAFGSHLVTMSDYTGGLSIFIPRLTKSSLLSSFHELKWYSAAGWDKTGW